VQFCGVRGSTPAPGADFVRAGGNTSCVAVWPEAATRPTLLLDAGTGIRSVSALLGGEPFVGTILLTHLHWDHVQGLPFFAAADRPDARVQVLVPEDGVEASDQLARAMSPPHFPIGPEGLRGRWTFATLEPGTHQVEAVRITAREVPHKGGRTFGFRLEDAHGSLAYVPDHLPAAHGSAHDDVVDLVRGVDVLIHDAQFVDDEHVIAREFGHSTLAQTLSLADEASVGELWLFHHAPDRTDPALDEIARRAAAGRSSLVRLAVEGRSVDVGGAGSTRAVSRARLPGCRETSSKV
jgi:phosphoribosyl 1,2-cyclic phosphodiesterase